MPRQSTGRRPSVVTVFSGLAALTLLLSGCSDDPVGPLPSNDQCTTDVQATTDGSFVALCAVEAGPVRHVRIEGLRVPRTHASAQIVFGFDEPPASPTETLSSHQFRVLLYGGGMPAPGPVVQGTFGDVDGTFDEDASFLSTESTVCFDLHHGGTSEAPALVFWVDGAKGADCRVPSTLSPESAYGAYAFWNGAVGAIHSDAPVYFRQASGSGATPSITLSTDPVLSRDEIVQATQCTGSWLANTEWQPTCDLPSGSVRHMRIEGIEAASSNNYFYAVLGQEDGPSGNPAPSPGKLIITGGRSNSGASWTWFRFDDGSTTQFSYETDAGAALYTEEASTICFDTGANDDGTARLVFWATGANGADCSDRRTLTLARALYDSTTDGDTGTLWDAPHVGDLGTFVKTNSADVTIGEVTLYNESAVLP